MDFQFSARYRGAILRVLSLRSLGDGASQAGALHTRLGQLQVQYHSIRQAAITREMTEIAAGAKALKRKRGEA